MKKLTGLVLIYSMVFLAACGNETETATAPVAPAPTKEVIVVQPEPKVIVKEAPAKPTTISLDKNGVKVGTKKVQIDINRDNK